MGSVLWPGMQLVRRLGVTGKFIGIALLLLLPLAVNVTAGWSQASGQLRVVAGERQGLVLLGPLVRLAGCLADAGNPEDDGAGNPDLVATVSDLDHAVVTAPEVLGSGEPARWGQVRAGVLRIAQLHGIDRAVVRALAADSRQQVLALIRDVAARSSLMLDPQLDGYYVTLVLADRLPTVVSSVAELERLRDLGTTSADQLQTGRFAVTDANRRLRTDLATARTATPDGLGREVSLAAATLDAAIDRYGASGPGVARPDGALRAISSSAAILATALSGRLDQLLAARQDRQAGQRREPLLLTLAALLAVGYLVIALYRATTQDVRAVLADISTVTNGALNQTPPLAGRDEFAQMSRAIIYARDRLTDLLGALRFGTTHDELTALGNRTLFQDKLEETLAERRQAAVLLIDIVRFRDVNDSFGHDIGDRLLRSVGARLHRTLGRGNLVARTAGDEFGLLLPQVSGSRDVRQAIAQLQVALSEPVDLDGRQFHVRVAVGAAVHAGGSVSARDLMRQAAVALSAAKSDQNTRVAFFHPSMQERTRDRTELSADLVDAVQRTQLSVLYQPIVDLSTGTLRGVEALIRWLHPTRGPISPTIFIPLAEATGLIVPVGRWVLREAVLQLAAWRQQFPDSYPITLDVNLSADQLADAALPGALLSLIDQTGIDPTRLVLEITESELVRDLELARTRLRQLSATGVRLALDDFGTGYSSLSYLRDLPVTVLKVDKAFVTGSEDGGGGAARLLRSIVDLGTRQGMEVIAEGVENLAQLNSLRRAGCRLGQGYLWSRPLPAEAVADLLGGASLVAVGSADHGQARAPGLE